MFSGLFNYELLYRIWDLLFFEGGLGKEVDIFYFILKKLFFFL